MSRVWDKSKPPKGLFTLNRDCQQAQGLVSWYPFGGASGKSYLPDMAGRNHLAQETEANYVPQTIDRNGAPAGAFNGSSTLFLSNTVPVFAAPVSVAARIVPVTTTGAMCAFGVFADSGKNRYQFDLSAGALRFACVGNASIGIASKSGVSAGVEYTVMGVERSTTSRTAYLNGVAGTTDTTSASTAGTANKLAVGCIINNSLFSVFFSGLMTDVALWNIALSNEVIARYNDPAYKFELWYPLRSRKWFSMGVVLAGQGYLRGVSRFLQAVPGNAVAGLGQLREVHRVNNASPTGAITGTGGTIKNTVRLENHLADQAISQSGTLREIARLYGNSTSEIAQAGTLRELTLLVNALPAISTGIAAQGTLRQISMVASAWPDNAVNAPTSELRNPTIFQNATSTSAITGTGSALRSIAEIKGNQVVLTTPAQGTLREVVRLLSSIPSIRALRPEQILIMADSNTLTIEIDSKTVLIESDWPQMICDALNNTILCEAR